ncbi:MAG: NAD(P)-binding domain-containing protein [Calditrichaeota bacterium]|nr:NAD(P)-binding domain-containing protein [Calditrichota bacterium]
MKVTILGGGLMGYAILHDLLNNYGAFEEIAVVEKNAERIEYLWKHFPNQDNLSFIQLDITDTEKLQETLLGTDIIISAVPYQYNLKLLEVALNIGAHFIDLGGNETILNKQLALDEKAARLGLIVIPACGLAPGLVSLLAIDGVQKLDRVEWVKMYCGGLPQQPRPPLNYQIVFSPHGLINEYLEPVKVIENGEIVEKPALSELETVHFMKPYEHMEAFLTSGGTGTLIYTLQGQVTHLFYKTIRYPGHAEKFKFLFDLGFKSDEPLSFESGEVSPRQMLEKLLEKNLAFRDPDVVLTRVIVSGESNQQSRTWTYEVIDVMDENLNLTAMMRTTGFTAAVVAQMIHEGKVQRKGVIPLEEAVDPGEFFQRLKRRGIAINQKSES